MSDKKCPACDYEATTRPLMLAHLRNFTKNGDKAHVEYSIKNKPFKCPVCDFRTQFKNGIGSHVQQQAKKNKDQAHIIFYQEQRNLVINAKHNGLEIGKIMKEPRLFFARVWVNNILQEVFANMECPICKLKVRDKIGLKNHITKQDDKEHIEYVKTMNWSGVKYNKLERCPVCNHESVWFHRHMRMKWLQGSVEHRKYMVKNYKICPVCEDRFPNHSALSSHFWKIDDIDHNRFIEKQRQVIRECFKQGLSIHDIQKKDNVYVKDLEYLSDIIKVSYTTERIWKQGHKVKGRKNSELYDKEPERREKASQRMRGSNNPSWHGGAGRFYRGGDWRSQQRLAHKTYGSQCICCDQLTYNGNKTQVHHVVPYRLSKSNHIENLRIICMRCHKIVENRLLSTDDSLVDLNYGLKVIKDVRQKVLSMF